MIDKIETILEKLQMPEVIEGQLQYEVLSLWAKSIVQECCDNFECEMEIDSNYIPDGGDTDDIIPKVPVLVRASILAVKQQIK